MAVTMKLTGDRELAAAFSRLGQAVQGRMLIGALEAGALLVVNDAKRRAAVDTGNLRRSLHVGDQQASGTDASVKVGTDVEYAPYVEFGTSRMAAQPYLRPALESQEGEVRAEVADALRGLIRGAVR
jgi:HK97 gp10 family phage protein